MKKYLFLIYYKEYHSFLEKLRDMGMVHIKERQKGNLSVSNSLSDWMNREKQLKSVIKSLRSVKEKENLNELDPIDMDLDLQDMLNEANCLLKEKERIINSGNLLKREYERISPWGDFKPENIQKLQNENIFIRLYTIYESKFKESWKENYNATIINKSKSILYFITITDHPEPVNIEAEEVKNISKSLSDIISEQDKLKTEEKNTDDALKNFTVKKLNTLVYKEREIKDHINWENVILNSEATTGDKLVLLEGYAPAEKEAEIKKRLEQEEIYFNVSEVTPDDNPPVLLKNNRFAKHFEVISNIYDRPSYHSFDFTSLYAPFYVIFFGLCLGDCGYGLLLLIASFFLSRAKKDFMKSLGKLVLWLGIGTIIFGFISGSFFGIQLTDQNWPWLEKFKGLIMDSNQLFYFALILGAIQLTFAMIVKVITRWMRFGFVYSLDTIGWITVIWGNIITFLFGSNGIISSGTQTICHYLISISGLIMMLFFNKPEKGIKGIFSSIGSGLWGLYNKVSGIFGDMLSYIRLFALGISGAVMGLVFNQLAFNMAPDIVVLKQLIIIVILLFGHAMNLFMSGLSAFVHPMRLTFVEFYNNAGFEGGGKPYVPFQKEANNQ